jgi:hypothetical protein
MFSKRRLVVLRVGAVQHIAHAVPARHRTALETCFSEFVLRDLQQAAARVRLSQSAALPKHRC